MHGRCPGGRQSPAPSKDLQVGRALRPAGSVSMSLGVSSHSSLDLRAGHIRMPSDLTLIQEHREGEGCAQAPRHSGKAVQPGVASLEPRALAIFGPRGRCISEKSFSISSV